MPDRRKRQRWAERRAKGLCGECGQVPSLKFSRCDLCRSIVSEQRKAWWRKNRCHLRALRRRAYWADVEARRAQGRREWAEYSAKTRAA